MLEARHQPTRLRDEVVAKGIDMPADLITLCLVLIREVRIKSGVWGNVWIRVGQKQDFTCPDNFHSTPYQREFPLFHRPGIAL